jgi:predicted amidohydrolase
VKRTLRVAAAQLGPIQLADSRASVIRRILNLMEEAHSTGCQVVVYPELALTTFFPRHWRDSTAEVDQWFEREMPSADTRALFEAAVRLRMSFYLGYAELAFEQGSTRRYNTSILVGPDGAIVGKYRKVHLPGHRDFRPSYPFQQLEKRYFDVGNLGFPVWWHRDVVMGMAICNDRRWPETYRVMGLQDVELIMLGYNTHTINQYHAESKHLKMLHHHIVMQAGAYQNGTWIVASAKTGIEDGCELMGGSCIVAPTGEIVAHAVTQEDELISFNCDMDLGRQIKENRFNFADHRRIEHYGLITQRAGAVAPPKP